MKRRLLSILLTLALALGMLPAAALAADDITVKVRFIAPTIAADMDLLRSDLIAAGLIEDSVTALPGEITVTVPAGSTVKAVLEAAQQKTPFTIVGLDNDYVTQVGFVGNEVITTYLMAHGSDFNYAGWMFYVNGSSLENGIAQDTVATDGAVVEGRYFLYGTWSTSEGIIFYDQIWMEAYQALKSLTRQAVDTSAFSPEAVEAYHAAKSEAETLLATVDSEANLNSDVAEMLQYAHPTFHTNGGMWLGYIDAKGTSLWGPGSMTEKLQKAAEKLQKGIDNELVVGAETACDLESLAITEFLDETQVKALTPAFDAAVTSYTAASFPYSTEVPGKSLYLQATAKSSNAVIRARVNGASSWTTVTGGKQALVNLLTPGKNTLEVQVAASDAADARTKTYTVSVLMAPDPAAAADPTTVMHNIAAKYAQNGLTSDPNALWLAADMAAYAQAFPDTNNRLSAAQVQACLDKFIAGADQHTKPNDLAKDIIAIRALGYDARKVVTSDQREIDVVKKLTDLVDAQDKAVSNQYTLPYVLIALQQGSGYATQAQLDWLIQKAVETQSSWQSTSWGTDGATPMMLALAPYCESNADVKAAVDAAADAVKAKQNEDGSVGSSNQAPSTGLAMAAFAALGQDPATAGGKHLADGLMAYVTDSKDGFQPDSNTFATEQGFRGLVAQARNGRVYDFTALPMETARATYVPTCPVEFTVIPEGASVVVKLGSTVQKPKAGMQYDLAAGSYTYTVSKAGYTTVTGSFEVTADEAAAHTPKPISVSLTSAPGGDAQDITVTVKVLTHDSTACGGSYTYKYNQSAYTVTLAEQTVTLKAGQSPFDALAKALAAAGLSYSEKSYGYIDAIGTEAEFGHGSANSGWQYMVNGTLPEIGCRDYAFTGDAALIWFFTDDYTRERGSEIWGGGGSTSTPVTEVEKTFTDISGHWSVDAIQYVYDRGLMEGVGETTFAPHATLSRSMLVTMLWRLAGKPAAEGSAFSDVPEGQWYAQAVAWAAAQGIVDGMTATTFAPDGVLSREQAAAMLYRYAQFQNYATGQRNDLAGYADGAQVSGWAVDAMQWANGASLINGRTDTALVPGGSATRAEAAAILMRFCENVAK